MSLNVLTQGGGTGGESASIFITGLDENSTVTAVKDGKTVQGKWTQKPIYRDGYSVLEYIKSTGTQYIDTLLQTTGSLRFWIDFSVENEISANDIGTVFGMRSSGIWEEIYDYALNTYPNFSGGTFQVGHVSVPAENVSADPKIVPNQRCQISYLGNTFTAADGTTTELAPQSFNASYTLFLFAKHIVNDVGEFGKVTLYRAKFYDGSTLIRDFVPMRRNADGVVGLYDVVNDVFYTDGRNGAFIAGSESPQYTYGHEIAKIKEYGMYTVTATNGEKTKTQDVLVDAAVEYKIEMDMNRLYLYKNGSDVAEVTGGWEAVYDPNTSYYGHGTFSQAEDALAVNTTGRQYVTGVTKRTIDVTKYKTVVFYIDACSSTGWKSVGCYQRNGLFHQTGVRTDIPNETQKTGEVAVDVSALSGNYYFVIACSSEDSGTSKSALLDVSEVYLLQE